MALVGLMRLSGVILGISVLASAAAADPIDQSAHPASEADGASAPATEVTEAPDAAGPSEMSRAPNPGAKPRAGNPLWALPLSTLSGTRDRPLFSPSRRPPIVAVPIVTTPPKQEALAPPPPERPLITLMGTIVSPEASLAVLQGSNAETISRLRVGQMNDGWRVQGIASRSIVVEKGEQSVELRLPRSNGAPAQ
jgi:hypothetical protein